MVNFFGYNNDNFTAVSYNRTINVFIFYFHIIIMILLLNYGLNSNVFLVLFMRPSQAFGSTVEKDFYFMGIWVQRQY